MKHDSPHSLGESPSFPAVCGTVRGGMTAKGTTTVEIRDNAYGTTPVFWWGWADEALLADFAEKDDRAEQADRPVKDDSAYATLYFVS